MTVEQLPADEDAEQAVLGAMLLGPTVGVDATAVVVELGLRAGDFYVPRHQHIAAAIIGVHARGDHVDVVLVAAELRRDGLLEAVGGIDTLHALGNLTPSVSNVAKHAALVAACAQRRRLIHLSGDLSDAALAGNEAGVEQALAELARSDAAGPLDDSWDPLDLEPILDGDLQRPAPTVMFRDDGRALLYPGVINGLHGDSGTGKGWVYCAAIAAELAEGGTVMLVDLEDTAESLIGRLRGLGVSNALLLDQLVYLRPTEPFDRRAVDRLVRVATDRDIALTVIDSLGEAFALEGLDENKDVDVGPWMRRVARPLADTGTAVLLVDHATKAADHPLHPSGSKRKRAAIGGASYLVTAPKPLSREHGGRLRLQCAKDRHGHYSRGEVAADLVIAPQGTAATLYAPTAPGDFTLPAILVARELVHIVRAAGRPMTMRAVLALVKTKARTDVKRGGLDIAVQYGALAEQPGPRGSRSFSYLQELPDDLV